jgi:hypothetical protein
MAHDVDERGGGVPAENTSSALCAAVRQLDSLRCASRLFKAFSKLYCYDLIPSTQASSSIGHQVSISR